MPKPGKFKTTLKYGFYFPRAKGAWTEDDHALAIEFQMIMRGGKFKAEGRVCGNGLPYHVKAAMKLIWPEMEWHRWSNLIIDEFLKSPGRTACFGPSSCVTGETRLENPITGESVPIRFLCENRIAPIVMTVNGPQQAEVPFLKGVAPIYEVAMKSGSTFRCTAEHRVMLSSGRYATVESLRPGALLQGYSRRPPLTTLELGQLVRASGALHSTRTTQGSQFDCRPSLCFGDAPLRSEGGIGQCAFPSQIDAQGYTECASFDLGDPVHTPARSHSCRGDARLSSVATSLFLETLKRISELRFVREILESEFFPTQRRSLYQSGIRSGLRPFSGSNPYSGHKRHLDAESLYCCDDSCGNEFMGHVDVVSTIRRSGTEEYYDLHVPVENHYFAEGCVHHNSGKSFSFSRAALVMFYAKPNGTTVLISSTTRDALTRRIWDYVVSSDKSARKRFAWLTGSLIESKMMLLADESDTEGRSFKNGIVGVACKKGGQWQGLEEYVGVKNDVVILIADEGHFMPMGFLDSLANLESNDNCYAAIMGNLPDIHNPLGRSAEPRIGWDALPDTDKTRVYETKWQNGRAVQLIGMDSPNLDYPEGQEPYKKLIGRRYIEQCAENYGRDSDKFNMFASGKIPKACMSRTVYTRAMCYKNHALEQVKWSHDKVVRGYMMDVAYSGVGGDRTPGAPFIFGKDVTGQWRFWIGPIRLYRGSDDPKLSHADAIAMEVRNECEAHDIPPEHFFYDGTGRSEFTSSLGRIWSAQVVPLEFGGRATERESFTGEKWGKEKPDLEGQVKKCCDIFDRFVTELWWAIRDCITSDQMRGMTEEMIDEGSQRRWEIVRGAKYSIEPKEGERNGEPVGMKARGLRSPDLNDMLAAGLEGARRLGFPLGKTTVAKVRNGNPWLDAMREKQWDDLKKEELAV